MGNVGISLLGNFKDKGKLFGKLGTKSDISIYHGKYGENDCFFVEPVGYPDKLQPLIYSINLCDHVLLFVSEINEQIGETILILKYLNKVPFVIFEEEWIKEDFDSLAKGISLKYNSISFEEFKEKLFELNHVLNKGIEFKEVVIDHSFPVKGVGNVILGRVVNGEINVYDKLILYPLRKEVLIKSIQINDKNCKFASLGSRVGLAIKGAEIEDLKRGYILSNNEYNISKSLNRKIIKNPFFKDQIKENQVLQVVSGLESVSCTIKKLESENIELELNDPIILKKEVHLVLLDNSKKLKFVGILS